MDYFFLFNSNFFILLIVFLCVFSDFSVNYQILLKNDAIIGLIFSFKKAINKFIFY
jgi:hypothetical protein